MTYSPEQQKTLLIPSGTFESPDKKHLFIIMTKECSNGEHLLIPVSSIKPDLYHDPACELAAGCHGFIRAKSYVLYAKAQKLKSDLLIKCVEGWVYTPKEPVDDTTFRSVCAGIDVSRHIPRCSLGKEVFHGQQLTWSVRMIVAQPGGADDLFRRRAEIIETALLGYPRFRAAPRRWPWSLRRTNPDTVCVSTLFESKWAFPEHDN